jgi:hypothetical protein
VQINRKNIRDLLEEAFYEVLSEQELKTASQEILGKFPTLKRQLVALLSAEFEEFIDEIKWIAPKPSTFQVVLQNGEKFFLKWNGAGFEAQIAGKKYALNYVSEFQQALDKLNELLKAGPMKSLADMDAEADAEADDDFGGGGGDFGGGDDDFGGEEGGEDFGDLEGEEGEEGEEEGGEEIEFEEPGEEPEA